MTEVNNEAARRLQAADPLHGQVRMEGLVLKGAMSDMYADRDRAEKRMADALALDAAELAHANITVLEHLLWHALHQLRVADMEVLLADRRVTQAFLNCHHTSFTEGDERVTYLSYLCLQPTGDVFETNRKLRMVEMLLDKGVRTINVGYYLMGDSGYTAFMAACDVRLWADIGEERHRAVVKRLYELGGKPNYGQHPLDNTARNVAAKHAPYLLDLLPLNEESSGQLSLFANKADMPTQNSPALQRFLNTPSFLLTAR
jgi:hypothetical protein